MVGKGTLEGRQEKNERKDEEEDARGELDSHSLEAAAAIV